MMAWEFFGHRLGRYMLWFAIMAVTAVFLSATGTPGGVLLIVFIFWLLMSLCMEFADFIRYCSHVRELESIMDQLEQKYLFAECAPKPQHPYERRLFKLMGRSSKAMIEAVSYAQSSQREYREYIESWVHEIKTPMTAAKLLCRNVESGLGRRIISELALIDNHVERALFYARAESPEKDFLIRQANLSDIAAQAIQNHQSILIQSGVSIETNDLNHTVYTDSKWTAFILGQLLQNAVRYRNPNPVITLSARQLGRQVQMTIQDNGIGIPNNELPRVLERGFTGSNGRSHAGSTGIGLYLCGRLAQFLQIELSIKSEECQGTSVTLTFPAKENLSKV